MPKTRAMSGCRWAGCWGGLAAAIFVVAALVGLAGCQTEYIYVGPTVSGPAAVTVDAGQTATFTVVVQGEGPMQYQWMKGGVAIAGATGSSYTTPSTTSKDDGTLFSVTVWNSFHAVTSGSAMLTVITPASDYPVIIGVDIAGDGCSQPGETLTIVAINATAYQWELNGVAIPGATGKTYVATVSGSYSVVVSNALASVTSPPLPVSLGSMITTEPANVSLTSGQVGTFTVAAAGQSPFAVQWYRIAPGNGSGVAIAGATTGTYVTPVVSGADDGTKFYATVKDACGTVYTSSTATMSVTVGDVPPTIVVQPVGQSVAVGAGATFTALAVGTPTITYQWYEIPAGQTKGVAVSGATGTSYTVPASGTAATDNGDQYYVIATNGYGQATSQAATLAVGNGILIVTQPVSQYVQVGQTATFSVTAVSSLPLTYQWYEAAAGTANFVAVAGATAATYSVTNATVAESGSVFEVKVSNAAQTVTSSTAALFVGALNQINPLCDGSWLPHGSTKEIVTGGACSYQLVSTGDQSGQLVWQQLAATGNMQLSFTITMSNPSSTPGDGFTLTLADPSQGATLTSLGSTGAGLGAEGIPGFVLGFDTYENGPPDAPIVPYVGVTRGNSGLWENPWFNTNDSIAPLVAVGQVIQSTFAITLLRGQMTVTQNGSLIFSGAVNAVPPTAYLMFTASTGAAWETVVVSNFSGVVGAP